MCTCRHLSQSLRSDKSLSRVGILSLCATDALCKLQSLSCWSILPPHLDCDIVFTGVTIVATPPGCSHTHAHTKRNKYTLIRWMYAVSVRKCPVCNKCYIYIWRHVARFLYYFFFRRKLQSSVNSFHSPPLPPHRPTRSPLPSFSLCLCQRWREREIWPDWLYPSSSCCESQATFDISNIFS